MYPPGFHDCILSPRTSIWNFVESYFYLDGISDKNGWQKYRIDRIEKGISYLTPIPRSPNRLTQYLATAVKILSIATMIFPLVMLLAKHYYRKNHHFVIDPAVLPAVAPAAPKPAAPPENPKVRNLLDRVRPAQVIGNPVPAQQQHGVLDTHIARNFASVRIEPNWVLNDAMRFFGVNKNHRIFDLPRPALLEFLKRHAVEGRIRANANTTLMELAQKIAALKRDGVDGHKSYMAMLDIIDTVLVKAPYSDPYSEKGQLLRTIRARIVQLDKDRHQVLDQMMNEVLRGNRAGAEKLAEKLAERTIADAKSPGFEKVGPFFEGGWRRTSGGHRINVELLHTNGKWRFIIAQAGSGSGNHRNEVIRDRNQQPVQFNPMRLIPVKIFEFETEAEAKELVKQIALYKRGPDSLLPGNGSEGNGFYALFKNGKVIDEHNLTYRSGQKMGNCALRSQEEALFYICQRLGFVDVANAFQDTLEDKIARNAYPALKAKLAARGPKEAIKPQVEGTTKLTLSGSRVKHVLPMTESSRFVIGRLAEIELPKENGQFSREQAEIVMSGGKCYIQLHPRGSFGVTVAKANGEVKSLANRERVEIARGDVLKFSNSYQLAVS